MKMTDSRMKLIWIFAAAAILFVCQEVNAAGIVGREAPRMRISNWITPNPPTRANLEGKVYVIDFWATWCQPCVESIPHIIKLADKFRDKGVLFIGLSQDKSGGQVRNFIREKGINYHIGMDSGISKRFLFKGIPTAFVINHAGKVVWQGHPMSEEFEAAIAGALEAAPQPFLDGVELGPFEDFRLQLSGGRDFVKVYRRLKSEAERSDSEDGEIAGEIIEAIDSRIAKKIEEAASLRESDPAAAFGLYRQIVKNYRGIEAAKPAVAAHDELRNDEQVKREAEAGKAVQRAQSLLARCRGCSSCGDFNPGCKLCVELNRTAIGRLERRLTSICKNYRGAKAEKTAQKLLKELNSEALQGK